MTKHDSSESGEARHNRRRNAFWRYLALAFSASILIGFLSGMASGMYASGDLPLWVPLLAGALAITGITWFSFDYFKRIDELDLMDNLWAHLAGMYGGIITIGGWYLLAELGLIRFPTAADTIIALLGFTFLFYGIRKLGLR